MHYDNRMFTKDAYDTYMALSPLARWCDDRWWYFKRDWGHYIQRLWIITIGGLALWKAIEILF